MHHSSATAHSLLFLAALLPLSALQGEQPIMTIAEAKAHLARREFHVPVRVRGVITFSNQRLGLAYMQDSSGGIGFDPRTKAKRLPIPGELIEVEGYLRRRQGMVMILKDRAEFGAPEVKLISQNQHSVSPLRFDLDQASQLRIDGLLTRVSGVVRRIMVPPQEDSPMLVEISSPSGYAIARLPWREPQALLDHWLNAPVTMKAVLVCRAEPPMLPEDADALLLVSSKANWSMKMQEMEQVFQRPPVKGVGAIQATPRSAVKERVHVTGTVTAAKPRAWVCLRTEEGSIEVSTRQMENFVPGQRLSVAGWPQNQGGMLMLQDGVCRILSQGQLPQPMKLEQGFFHPGMQRELVEVIGTLKTHSLPEGSPRFTLSLPNDVSCRLAWETFLQANQLRNLENESRIQLTGLCHLLNDGTESAESIRLSILPRSLTDIVVLSGPSWWTPERLTLAVWWLLGILGIALPGALIFRWQIWRQARHIHEIESKAATEEERLRIAREFHDSLQQQLTSAALHLETLKGALRAAPEMVPGLIEDTTAMLRHCQIETRHCIWDLRSEMPIRNSLTESLKDWLHHRMDADSQTQVEFIHEGRMPELPEEISFQLMRITQESVTNALAHASAAHIWVTIKNTGSQLDLIIEDDGRGFDSTLLSKPKTGHFGLCGLKERAVKVGAKLNVFTQPGKGTRVSVSLPLISLKHEPCT